MFQRVVVPSFSDRQSKKNYIKPKKNFSCTALETSSPVTQHHIPKDTHSYAHMHTEQSI